MDDNTAFIFAIDPGLNGAWATLSRAGAFVDAGELPRYASLVNGIELTSVVRGSGARQAVIERVHSMPKQGVASSFTFGCAYGTCIGVVCGLNLPISFVTPPKWKAHFRLTGSQKDASRERAIQLYPEALAWLNLKKHHGRADAILLARYFRDMAAKGEFV